MVWKEPTIAFIANRCVLASLLSCEVVDSWHIPYLLGRYQMDAAWSVLGATTEVNSWRIYLNCAPHVLLPILDIASANFVPFLITYCRCDRKRSFWSKITPRYRASDVGWMVMLLRVIDADVLILLFRVKWTRRYLDGSNCIPCFCLQHSASSSMSWILSAFPSAVSPFTQNARSSMNPRLCA